MTDPALIMAGVAATAATAGGIILIRPARSEQAVYIKRIAGTMALALALILTVYAWALAYVIG